MEFLDHTNKIPVMDTIIGQFHPQNLSDLMILLSYYFVYKLYFSKNLFSQGFCMRYFHSLPK